MRNKLKLLLLFSVSLLLVYCSKEPSVVSDKNTVTIGTFNVEWLGDGINDRKERTEDDYREIAQIIKDTGADMLGLEEVENETAVKKVLKYLPGFDFYIGTTGGKQKVGVIFKKDIKVDLVGEYVPLEVEQGRARAGLLLKAKKGNFDWLMMVVHLKSSSHFENTEEKMGSSQSMRREQSEVLANWSDSVLSNGKEKDIIILGDFNDTPMRKRDNTLEPLLNDNNLAFLTKNIRSCKYKSAYAIDQIVISKQVMSRYITNSERAYDIYSSLPSDKASHISDHCPVTVKFDVTAKDNN